MTPPRPEAQATLEELAQDFADNFDCVCGEGAKPGEGWKHDCLLYRLLLALLERVAALSRAGQGDGASQDANFGGLAVPPLRAELTAAVPPERREASEGPERPHRHSAGNCPHCDSADLVVAARREASELTRVLLEMLADYEGEIKYRESLRGPTVGTTYMKHKAAAWRSALALPPPPEGQ